MNEKIVFAEIESVTEEMRNDPKVLIISDGALFMVTTKTNSKWYNYKFETVGAEAIEAYKIQFLKGSVKPNNVPCD